MRGRSQGDGGLDPDGGRGGRRWPLSWRLGSRVRWGWGQVHRRGPRCLAEVEAAEGRQAPAHETLVILWPLPEVRAMVPSGHPSLPFGGSSGEGAQQVAITLGLEQEKGERPGRGAHPPGEGRGARRRGGRAPEMSPGSYKGSGDGVGERRSSSTAATALRPTRRSSRFLAVQRGRRGERRAALRGGAGSRALGGRWGGGLLLGGEGD